jgi:uncharacterized protein (DUF58 family)
MIKPTRRMVILFAAGLPPSLMIVIADPSLWTISVAYGALIFFAMAADALLAMPAKALTIDFKAPAKMFIGEKEQLSVIFKPIRYRREASVEMLLEQRGDLERAELAAITLHPGSAISAALPVTPTRRGLVHFDWLWLRWNGPWSLVQLQHRAKVDRTIEVAPNVRGARNAALHFITQEAVFGEKVQEKGEGAEFDALKEYLPGDDIRFIDWKRSAKHRKPVSKEFRAERNHHIILAFDTGHLMVEPLAGIPRLDHAINAGLALSWIGLRGGDLVGAYAFDAKVRNYQAPVRGAPAFSRIQRATAEMAYHYEETNFTLGLAELSARLKRRALVVLFTDFVDTITAELLLESVQRLTKRHAIIFVTLKDSYLRQTADAAPNTFAAVARSVIAHDFLQERGVVFERLARMGVHCLDVPNRGLSARLINRYLQIKQRGLI